MWKIYQYPALCDLSAARDISRISKISTYAESQTSLWRKGLVSRAANEWAAASFIHTRESRETSVGHDDDDRDDDANESEGEDDDNVVTAKRAISSRQSRSSRSSRCGRAQQGAGTTNRIILGDHGRFLTVDLLRSSLSLPLPCVDRRAVSSQTLQRQLRAARRQNDAHPSAS